MRWNGIIEGGGGGKIREGEWKEGVKGKEEEREEKGVEGDGEGMEEKGEEKRGEVKLKIRSKIGKRMLKKFVGV